MSKKSEYYVTIPITGHVGFTVTAEDKESAKEAAWQAIDDGREGNIEWEYTSTVCSGNVFHGMQNNIDVIKER